MAFSRERERETLSSDAFPLDLVPSDVGDELLELGVLGELLEADSEFVYPFVSYRSSKNHHLCV